MERHEQVNWVGVDWGGKGHAVCVVDGQGQVTATFQAPHCPEGLEMLVARLGEHEPLGGVAVETHRHVMVQALLDGGLTVYSINPKVSHNWRKGWAVCEAKDDARDALVLANGLRQHHGYLRPFTPDTPEARELALLCEDERRLIGHRTALVQQLKDTLKQYFPAALDWFSDWTTQTAWDFVLTFPTAEAIATANKQKIVGFLKRHRIGLGPKWKERVENRGHATDWPCDDATANAKSLLAISLAKQLRALAPTLKAYRKHIDALFSDGQDRALFQSLPGAGEKLAPRLASGFGTQRERFASAQSVQQLSGTAPVTQQSGKRRHVRIRRACQKGFRTTLHLFAWQSVLYSRWARAYYDLARRRGQGHSQALRNLANKWLKIIYRMWQERKPYDEQRYIEQLVKRGSPVAFELGLLGNSG